jgi:Periplasmic copper-binding protein (NosD)
MPGEPTPSHAYASPGVYYVSQSYVVYNAAGEIIASGTCTRPVTVGCCCSSNPGVLVEFLNDCDVARSISIKADACCGSNKCQSLRLKVGTNPWLEIDPCQTNEYCLTNYNSYLSGLDGKIQVEFKTFCHGQPVVKNVVTEPPVEGVYLGLDPTDPYNCNPGNTQGYYDSGNNFPASDPMKSTDNACGKYFSRLSQYTALPGAIFQGSNGQQTNVFVQAGSIIEVDKSFTFANNVKIIHGSGSGWTILHRNTPNSGNTFEIASSVSMVGTICCMWRGVIVAGSGTFRSQSTAQGTNNYVEDAIFAVRPISVGNASPRLAIRDTKFIDNFISILGNSGQFSFLGSVANPYFIKNEFASTGPLYCVDCDLQEMAKVLPAGIAYSTKKSFAGIFLEGGQPSLPFNGVPFTSLNFIPTLDGDHNVFRNLALGIAATNISVRIPDMAQFIDIDQVNNDYGSATAIGIRYEDRIGGNTFFQKGLVQNGSNTINFTSFNNCRIGISALAGVTGLPSNITVSDNRMLAMRAGVWTNFSYAGGIPVGGDWSGQILRNQITSTNLGIAVDDPSPGASSLLLKENVIDGIGAFGTGIIVNGDQLNGSLQMDIDNNTISSAGDGVAALGLNQGYIHDNTVTSSGGVGYRVQNSRAEIECNNALGSSVQGLLISDTEIVNDLSFNTASNTGTGMEIQNMSPAEELIHCNSFSNNSMGLRYEDATTGPQTNTGNMWTAVGAEYVGGGAQASIYRVPPTAPWQPSTISPNFGWFILDATLSPPVCNKACVSGMKPSQLGDLDVQILQDQLTGPDWMQYRFDQYLLHKLLDAPSLVTANPAAAAYQNTMAGQAVSQLASARWQATGLFALPGALQADLALNQAGIATRMSTMRSLEEALADNLSSNDLDLYLSQLNLLSQEVQVLQLQNQSLIQQAATQRATAAAALRNSLTGVSSSLPSAQNEQVVLDLSLAYLGQGIVPTAAELLALKTIGEQCPKTGGAAVYWAATLYRNCTGETLIQADCAPNLGRGADERDSRRTHSESAGLLVFPNPSNQSLSVVLPKGVREGHIELRNALGILLLSQAVEGEVLQIDLSGLPSGLVTAALRSKSMALPPVQVLIQH